MKYCKEMDNSNCESNVSSEKSLSLSKENSQSVSKQSKRVKKSNKKKKQTNLQGNNSETKKNSNWEVGRPGPPQHAALEEGLDANIKQIMLEHWFGREISMKILIYLCKEGNMIFKVKTGKPAEEIKKGCKQLFESESDPKKYKKYKKQLKKQLKEKYVSILKYLKFDADTTYFLLSGNNQEYQLEGHLESDVLPDTKQGIEVIMKYLSPDFVKTYLLIVDYFYFFQKYYQSQEYIISQIIENLQANYIDHQMIFKIQIIKELLKVDLQLINDIDNSPEQLQLNCIQKTSIVIPDFKSKTFEDNLTAIFDKSYENQNWLYEFIKGLVDILQCYK